MHREKVRRIRQTKLDVEAVQRREMTVVNGKVLGIKMEGMLGGVYLQWQSANLQNRNER